MEREYRKRNGLFIKKGDDLLDSVSLKEFSFREICDVTQVNHDNQNSNLIYKKYHREEEINAGVKPHGSFHKDMRDGDHIKPTLQPLNFTEDWERQLQRAAKRKNKPLSEEEEELAQLRESQKLMPDQLLSDEKSQTASEDSDDDTESSDVDLAENKIEATKPEADLRTEETDSPPTEEIKYFNAQKDNLDTVGAAINTIGDGTVPEETHDPHFSLKKGEEGETSTEEQNTEKPENQPVEDFIPVQATDDKSVQSPEEEAMKNYREITDNPNLAPSNLKKQVEEAKSQGYEDGYKQGEQKASLQVKNDAEFILNNVDEILSELSHLKKNILNSAQENFYELSQAIAESLISRELKVDAEAFNKIVSKAIQDSIEDDQFTIFVHPDFVEKLEKLDLSTKNAKIQKDENVEPGNFRIESKSNVIDGNLRQIIGELLEEADIDLFETDKVAG